MAPKAATRKRKAAAHSEVGASGAERWLECPGSVAMCRISPPGETSPHAAEGTKAHTLAEKILRAALRRSNLREAIIATDMGGYPLDMRQHVIGFCEYVWGEIERTETRLGAVEIEKRVVLSKTLKMFGTADVCWSYLEGRGDDTRLVLRVIDLKYGQGKFVDVTKTPQLPYYGLAYALSQNVIDAVSRVDVTIYQPRALDASGEKARTQSYSQVEMDAWREKFLAGAELSLALAKLPQAAWILHAGPHCQFCPAKGICGEYARASSVPGFLDMDTGEVSSEIVAMPTKLPAALPDERIAEVLRVASSVKDFLKAVEKYAIARDKASTPIPGWRTYEKLGGRMWDGEDEEVAKGLEELGVNPWRNELRTISDVERELVAPGAIDHLTKRKKSTTTLVPIEDGKTADDLAAEEFGDFEE